MSEAVRKSEPVIWRPSPEEALERLRAMGRSPYAPEPPRRHRGVDAALVLGRMIGRAGTVTPHLTGGSDEAKVRWEYEGAPAFLELLRAYGAEGLFAGRVVLDAGCGWGGKALYFAETCGPAEVHGFDLPNVFDPAVPQRIAREQRIANCRFTTGFAEQMPLADASVDLVIMEDVLEHVRDPERTLGECGRVLRPGGRIVIKFPSFRMVSAHHLERGLHLPALQYIFSMKTWAAGLNDALLRDSRLNFEPFSEVVATRYQPAVTRDLNGLDFRSFRTIVEYGPWDAEVLELVPHRDGPARYRIIGACYRGALKVGPLREALSATVLFVGRRR